MGYEDSGTMPRISINPQVRGLELRRPSVQKRINDGLPFVRRIEFAYAALQHLCRAIEPYLPYAEVLTVKFSVLAGSKVVLDLGVVVVEPHTIKKFEVSHNILIGRGSEAEADAPAFYPQQDLQVMLIELANQVARTLAITIRDRSSQVEGLVFDIGRFHAHAPGLVAYQIEVLK